MRQSEITLMNSPKTRPPMIPRVFALFIFTLVGTLLIFGPLAGSNAQTSEHRLLEEKIPKHLPIKLRLRKENLFKDLKNEQWLRDFELEVTNTGDKPIYFLGLLIGLPEVTGPDGYNVGFGLQYGRKQMEEIRTKAEPVDVPIKPGETYVFRVGSSDVQAWGRFRKAEGLPDATKIILRFQVLSFGDATGFLGVDGKAVPSEPEAK